MTYDKNKSVIHTIYNYFIRRILPNKISVHNGIPVRDRAKLFDLTDNFPDYELALISSIRKYITQNEMDIVLIGGGLGVSTVATIEAMGREGVVRTYEGSAKQHQVVQNTISLNGVEDCVDLNHSVVGKYLDYSSESYGDSKSANIENPSSLPECDALILDCEGAEKQILENITIKPEKIIVETHSFLGSSEEKIKKILKKNDYEIIDRGVELESKGVYVLTASLQ